MALHPTEAAQRLLRQAGRAAQESKAPACEMLVDVGKRELAQGTPEGAVNAAFVAGRAFACAASATMRGAFGAARRGRGFGDGATYKTFKRAARNWEEFSHARKITVDRGLTYEEAQRQCKRFNANLTAAQIRRGLKCEFTSE